MKLLSNGSQHSKSGFHTLSVSIACVQSHEHCERYYLYAAFFSSNIFIMPVTPNIHILRVLEKLPFSNRSRDERRLRSQQSASQLRTPTAPPISLHPGQTICPGETAVTIIGHGSTELNIQPQRSLCLAPDPTQSPLSRLRHKTSKWFANKCAAKGMSTILIFSYPLPFPRLNRVLTRFRQSFPQSFCNLRLNCSKGNQRDNEPSPGN